MPEATRVPAPERAPLGVVSPVERALLTLVAARAARVGVLGLRTAGVRLACVFAEAGFPVIGFGSAGGAAAPPAGDPATLRRLGRRLAPLRELIGASPTPGRIAATDDPGRLAACDAVLLPVSSGCERWQSAAVSAAGAVVRTLRARQLLLLVGVPCPDEARAVVEPILASGGLALGWEVFLAASSRGAAGRRGGGPAAVSGATAACVRVATALLDAATRRVAAVVPGDQPRRQVGP